MTGSIQRRVSPITGKVTYRVRVFVGQREGGSGWVSGGSFKRLKAEAEPALEALLKRLRGEEEACATDETVAELLERFIRDAARPDKAANTVRSHVHAASHITPTLGDTLAADLTPAEVAAWQAAQISAGCAPKSVRNYRGTLHACYAWALELGLVSVNPVSAVRAPRLPERRTEAPSLAMAQQYIASLSQTRLWPALMIGATTGMRRGEVLALRWMDVDMAGGTVTISRGLTGHNRATLEVRPPKSRAGRRAVPLPAACVDMLVALQAERKDLGMWSPEALICCGRRGQPIIPDGFTHELGKRIRRRGLAPLHFHALRHMVATELLRAGERMDVVAAHLGHAHVATTLGVYGHVTDGDRKAAAERLDVVWSEAASQTRVQSASKSEPLDELAERRACK